MFKTYIDIPRRDRMYYMVHDIITMRNGWDVITTITRPDHIRIYFSYKWFQYGKVRALKKAVKNYAKQFQYYDTSDSLKLFIARRDKLFSEQCKKAIAGFSNDGIQGNPESRDDETTVNKERSK